MEKSREYFKNLLAEHSLDILYDDLFALMSQHQARHRDKFIAEKHDELVLLSGKLNSVQQSQRLGTISPEELNIEVSRINFALLDLLNDLPDSFFQEVKNLENGSPTGGKKHVTIPAGLSNGLFWMASAFMAMITLGSLIQKNWVTFALTLLATLICMPATFHFLADKLKISLSGSIRVLLIIVLTSVGLSFAKPKEEGSGNVGQPRLEKQ